MARRVGPSCGPARAYSYTTAAVKQRRVSAAAAPPRTSTAPAPRIRSAIALARTYQKPKQLYTRVVSALTPQ